MKCKKIIIIDKKDKKIEFDNIAEFNIETKRIICEAGNHVVDTGVIEINIQCISEGNNGKVIPKKGRPQT